MLTVVAVLWSEARVIWSKRILNPLDRVVHITRDRDDIEAHGVARVALLACKKQGGRTQEFALFALINCRRWSRINCGCPVTNFDECQALAMQHNQIDFTAATSVVACDWP